jgi:hypothetical protein
VTKRLSLEDFEMAIEWLSLNEDFDEGSTLNGPCKRVAEFLRKELTKREDGQSVRQIAKDHGLTIKHARKVLKKAKEIQSNGPVTTK